MVDSLHSGGPRVVCVIGTRAQTIKMAPVLLELERQAVPYQLFLTGQHKATILELLEEFQVATAAQFLYRGQEIKSIGAAIPWFIRTAWRFWRRRGEWAGSPRSRAVVLVHGDTFSTLLGALIARLVRARVAHVEAGLRSFNLTNPFPEELIRIAVSALIHVGYCPGKWACGNLRRFRVELVDTRENTLLDSLRYALKEETTADAATGRYALFSIHRFENLYSSERVRFIVDLVERVSRDVRVIFVMHPATERRLEKLDHMEAMKRNPAIELHRRMTYRPFIRMAGQAQLVVTDGGSNQEELSYLGVATILMRMASERQEGLGDNVLLARYDAGEIYRFIGSAIASDPAKHSRLPEVSPSTTITEHLRTHLVG